MSAFNTSSPRIFHVGTRLMIFSDTNQITYRDMLIADVAIYINSVMTFRIVKDRFKETTDKNYCLSSLGDTLSEYYQLIRANMLPVEKEKTFKEFSGL